MGKPKAVAAELEPLPKALVRTHSQFVERTVTAPSGTKIKISKVKCTGGTHYRVSVDGKFYDTALTIAKANAIVRELWRTHGRLL